MRLFRFFYRLRFVCILLLVIQSCSPKDQTSGDTNILFILADDMGWQDTSEPFYSEVTKFNQRYHTPHLERLADEGMKFTQAYACAVCSPTRVSLMTGQNEARHHVTQWTYLSGDAPSSDIAYDKLAPANWNWNGLQPQPMPHAVHVATLPELLKKAGYTTMIFGKGHLGAADTPGADPKNLGFDIRVGGRDAGGCGSYYGEEHFGAKAHPDGPWRAWDLDQYFDREIHLTEALTREAQKAIAEAVKAENPFFCYMAHYAPHTPIDPDPRFVNHYLEAGLDSTEAAYASLLQGVDQSTGDLLATLDSLDIAENTLVIFTSDNGGVSHKYRSMDPPHTHNAPLSSGKGAHHEGGIRVPLLVRWPGQIAPEQVSEVPVMIYDWFPTFMKIADINPPHPVDGLSLISVLEGQRPQAFQRPLVWHFPNFWGPLQHTEPVAGPGMGPSSTLRDGDFKIIYYHADQSFELFNLKDDLGEHHNLAETQPGRVETMAVTLGNYLRERNAPMPVIRETGEPVPWPDQVNPYKKVLKTK